MKGNEEETKGGREKGRIKREGRKEVREEGIEEGRKEGREGRGWKEGRKEGEKTVKGRKGKCGKVRQQSHKKTKIRNISSLE